MLCDSIEARDRRSLFNLLGSKQMPNRLSITEHSSGCSLVLWRTASTVKMERTNDHPAEAEVTSSTIDLASGKAMIVNGSRAVHGYVAAKFEAAIGGALPQMGVCYSNLSITADVTVIEDVTAASELPTLFNTVKRSLAKLSPSRRVVRKVILKNASGVFQTGTITLLLGQPGSGKSSLMKILGGQFPVEKNIMVEGDITYNGISQRDILKRLPQFAAYVTQSDRHFPTLTVRETLEFAHKFCAGGRARWSLA
jgi:ABC-type transport system involved in cytochrome bd biosynthesis fused ATPase/permease subunit